MRPAAIDVAARSTTLPQDAERTTAGLIRDGLVAPPSPALSALTDGLLDRFGASVAAVLFYGSVRRGADEQDGLLDLLVVVDGYRRAYGERKLAAMNRLLPPNVFYLEARSAGRTVRCKYAVVSLRDLRRYTRPGCLQVYFWGRFAQPCGLAWSRGPEETDRVAAALAQAVRTFLLRTAPLAGSPVGVEELWVRGLSACYATELRAERPGAAARLVATERHHYEDVTLAAARELGWPHLSGPDGPRLAPPVRRAGRVLARVGWRVRRVQGKLLHVLRLLKGAATFDGGVDYILWKIERHSGVRVEVSDRVRRHPFLAGWGTLWKLYRRGAFR